MAKLITGGMLLVLLAGSAPGQQRQQVPPSFQTGVTLVPLDVRVLDRNGAPVNDLELDDFIVIEDGVPQHVRHFERSLLAPDPAAAAAPLPLRSLPGLEMSSPGRRVFLVVLGRIWLPDEVFGTVAAITRFLRERLLPQDYVALAAWNRATDFSTDHDGVAQVVERLYEFQRSVRIERGMPGVRETYRSLFRPTPPDIQARLDPVFGIDKGAGRTVPPVAGIEVRPLLEQIERHAATLASASVSFGSPQSSRAKADAHAREIAAGGANHVLNIYTGVQYLRHIEGEKHLIYVSPGGVLLPALEDDAGLAGLGSDARVAIHVIQTGGLPKGGLGLLSLEPSMASKHVAELTGGQAFSAQYPDRALATIDEVTRVGYVLGYYPADTNFDGNSRRIDVRVRRPPGATVLFRHTYVASVEPRTYDHRTFIVQDRIMAAAEYDRAVEDIRVVLDGRRSGKSVTASIVVDATQVSLVTEGDSRRGRLDVAVFCTDGRERLLGQVWQKIDLALSPATYDRLLTDGIRHSAEIPVTGPPVWLKAVVYDYEADRVGSAIVRVR